MSRNKRLWKGVGPLALGGLILAGGISRADDNPAVSKQLTELGKQALAQGNAAQARTFFLKALELDPKDPEALKGSVVQVAFQDPAPPASAEPEDGKPKATLEAAANQENVARQQVTDDVRRRLQEARNLVNSGSPEAALSTLKLAQNVVRGSEQIDEATKTALDRQIQAQILSTVHAEQRIVAQRLENQRVAASAEQQERMLQELEGNIQNASAMMTQFDSLMTQGQFNVRYNGGTNNIAQVTEPFAKARILAQEARALIPGDPTPVAGVFVAQAQGFLAQELAFEYLKEYRFLLTMQDVSRAAIPFPDNKFIEYPDAATWRDLSERRIKRYGTAVDLVSRDAKTKSIIAKLDEPVSLNFPEDTPLSDVLKYIKDATQGANDSGIPIYVDPIGLADAEQTMSSPVKINLDGVPLKTTLKLMLNQLGLIYTVNNGLLTITGKDAEDQPTEIRVYPVADLSIIPLSLLGGGGGGGGGMGGGGMGGGGMGGGGMGGGGMGGGGMGGGGMMSVPVQDPADQDPASTFLQKKSN